MEVLDFVKAVNTKRGLDLNKLQVKAITTSLSDIGIINVTSLNKDDVARKILVAAKHKAQRRNPLKVIAAQTAKQSVESCPVCRRKMELINVAGRKALYCPEHRVTVPLPVE